MQNSTLYIIIAMIAAAVVIGWFLWQRRRTESLKDRGYPIGDFEQRAADISVDHPRVVENYRRAHAIALRNENDGTATEELRTAMVHYRTLFEDLLESPVTERIGVTR